MYCSCCALLLGLFTSEDATGILSTEVLDFPPVLGLFIIGDFWVLIVVSGHICFAYSVWTCIAVHSAWASFFKWTIFACGCLFKLMNWTDIC